MVARSKHLGTWLKTQAWYQKLIDQAKKQIQGGPPELEGADQALEPLQDVQDVISLAGLSQQTDSDVPSPAFVMAMTFHQPDSAKKLIEIGKQNLLKKVQQDGVIYYRQPVEAPVPTVVGLLGESILLVGSADVIPKILKGPPEHASPLSEDLKRLDAEADLVAAGRITEELKPLMAELQLSLADSQLKGLAKLPDQVIAARLVLKASPSPRVTLTVKATNDQVVPAVEQQLRQLSFLAKTFWPLAKQSLLKNTPQAARAEAEQAGAIVSKAIDQIAVSLQGREISLSVSNFTTLEELTALAGQAVERTQQASQEQPASLQATPLGRSQANLKALAAALFNAMDTDNLRGFPRGIGDAAGQPLLSWRVAILPYIGQGDLYQRFHLDESWDSNHNKTLLNEMPTTFQHPTVTLLPGKTVYRSLSGQGMAFEEKQSLGKILLGPDLGDFTDDPETTLTLVEVAPQHAVEWTKPEAFAPNPENPAEDFGSYWNNRFLGAFADGRVSLVPQLSPAELKTLLTIRGSEPSVLDQ